MGLAKTMNVDSSYSLCTSYMLDKTQQWSAKGNWFNRQITARAIGMSTSAAMLADAVTHLALFTGKSLFSVTLGMAQPGTQMGMSHWNMKEAMIHLAKTVAYVAASVLNLGVAFVSPSYQIRGLVATGLSEQPKALRDGVALRTLKKMWSGLKQLGSGLKKLPNKAVPSRRVAIGLGVVGAAIGGVALAHRYELITVPNPTNYLPTRETLSAFVHTCSLGYFGQQRETPAAA